MILTERERAMLDGAEGPIVAEALDYIVQLGEAFDAERLVDIGISVDPHTVAKLASVAVAFDMPDE